MLLALTLIPRYPPQIVDRHNIMDVKLQLVTMPYNVKYRLDKSSYKDKFYLVTDNDCAMI